MASLPQKLSIADQRKRLAALDESRPQYAWEYPADLPAHIASTPASEKPIGEQLEWVSKIGMRYTKEVVEGRVKAAHERLKTLFGGRDDPLDQYKALFDPAELPWIANDWEEDWFFGAQRLNGLQPEYITRVTKLPENWKITDADCPTLPAGTTLASLIADGLLYMIDHPELEGVPGVDAHDVIHSPTVLFHSEIKDGKHRLMPLAVRLNQKSTLIFTPKDPPNLWLAVKIAVNRASFALHMPRDHFLCFHFIHEVIYVSMRRHLSLDHPLSQVLKPHFMFHLFANDKARAKGGPFNNATADKIAKTYWKKMSAEEGGVFQYFNFPAELAARGVADESKLPGYHYRNEGLHLWATYHKFANAITHGIYATNDDIVHDYELQAWIKEMTNPIFGALTGLPFGKADLAPHDQLSLFLTAVLWTVTSHHSYSTTAGAQYYAFFPNQPACFDFKEPKDKTEITRKDIASYMPSLGEAVQQMAEIASIEVYSFAPLLKLYESDFLKDVSGGTAAGAQLLKDLADIEAQTTERAKGSKHPFTYFLPSMTARSVWN